MIKPFYLDLTEQEIDKIQSKFGEILKSGNLILSKYTEEFEHEFAKYIGCKYAVSLNSCTSALEALLMVKDAKNKKVAVPTNTNFATVAAIIRAGGIPIYMDMTPEYFVPDMNILKNTLKKHSDISGVVWVHIGGIIAPYFEEIAEFCKSKNIFLIEDCAHAHGSKMNDIYAGNFGDAGAFSFFPTKVMTTMEGGMVTTNSSEDAKLIKSIRNQGKRTSDYGGLHIDLGNSWRMSEIQAKILTDVMFEKYHKNDNTIIVNLSKNKTVKTKKLILSSGTNLQNHVGKSKLSIVASPLLIAYPAVCSVNFVRLTPFLSNTINHITHNIDGISYSLIGGGYFASGNDKKACKNAEKSLLESARSVFPALNNSELIKTYSGYKTEVPGFFKKLNYLYHIE